MPDYRAPGVYVEEEKGKATIVGASTSIVGFIGVARRGPVNKATLIASFDDFLRIFGSYDPERSDLAYAVEGFFLNGGGLCYVSRVAHYADITDPSSITSSAATHTINSIDGQPSPAVLLSADGPFQLQSGRSFSWEVDGAGPNKEITFASSRAILTGSADLDAAPYDPGVDRDLLLNINGWGQRTITFSSGSHDAAAAAALFSGISGISAHDDGAGHLVIETAFGGTDASLEIMVGSDAALLVGIGLVLGTVSGGGVFANDTEVTAAEIVALIEAEDPGTGLVSGDAFSITSPTIGAASQLLVPGGTSDPDTLSEFGFASGQIETGSANGSEATLKISASSEGLWGESLSVRIEEDPVFASQGIGNDLFSPVPAASQVISLLHGAGLREGVVLKITDGVNTEYREVSEVSRVVAGAAVRHDVTLKTALINAFAIGTSTVNSTEFSITVFESGIADSLEVWNNLSMLDTSDRFIEGILNDTTYGSKYLRAEDLDALIGMGADSPAPGDYALTGGTSEYAGLTVIDYIGNEATHLGIHAFDDKDDLSLLASPGVTDVALQQAILTYCETRQFTFAILGTPAGYSRQEAYDHRQVTGAYESSYGAIYWPRAQVSDPTGAGRDPRRFVDNVGHIAGVYARVDNQPPPNGGPWESPAGEGVYGQLKGVLGLETPTSPQDQEVLNPKGVNVLRVIPGKGILIYGARTLSSDINWRYINVRRMFIFAEQSIKNSATPELFRVNDLRLWSRLTNAITTFLRNLWRNGGLRGSRERYAFFVSIDESTTTAADIAEGRVVGRIGLAAQRPGEFIIFRFSQFEGIEEEGVV